MAAEGSEGVTDLPVASIKIGERRRDDMGDIDGLAASIDKHGLFHNVVVDDEGHLVAGHRRILAMQKLGWTLIPTKSIGELTDEERWECEQDENHLHKHWTPYEEAKKRVTQAEKDAPFISSRSEEKAPQGRPSTHGAPKGDLAKAQGISVGALVKAEQHVETAETYPVMQRPDWKQSYVLEAQEQLTKIPEQDRPAVVAIVSEPGTDAKTAVDSIAIGADFFA